MNPGTENKRIVNATAPIRICDLGGWTDTWFADAGAVCNIAVTPCAEVQICAIPCDPAIRQITIYAENYGERYSLPPHSAVYDKHPLLEASIDLLGLPGMRLDIHIYSAAPAGCSTGTSAAVSVALLGALDRLGGGRRSAHEIATLAHRVETEKLGLQCGVQDQLCSAYGGVCFIEMGTYPHATVSKIVLAQDISWEMERRLLLVYLGRSHSSSEIHGRVIHRLEQAGADKSVLEKLRGAAYAGRKALSEGDLESLGRAMIANTETQGELHPSLVSADARRIIDLARKHGARGWKVNGAGGEGGSLTILCAPEAECKHSFLSALHEMKAGFEIIPIRLCEAGLTCWDVRV